MSNNINHNNTDNNQDNNVKPPPSFSFVKGFRELFSSAMFPYYTGRDPNDDRHDPDYYDVVNVAPWEDSEIIQDPEIPAWWTTSENLLRMARKKDVVAPEQLVKRDLNKRMVRRLYNEMRLRYVNDYIHNFWAEKEVDIEDPEYTEPQWLTDSEDVLQFQEFYDALEDFDDQEETIEEWIGDGNQANDMLEDVPQETDYDYVNLDYYLFDELLEPVIQTIGLGFLYGIFVDYLTRKRMMRMSPHVFWHARRPAKRNFYTLRVIWWYAWLLPMNVFSYVISNRLMNKPHYDRPIYGSLLGLWISSFMGHRWPARLLLPVVGFSLGTARAIDWQATHRDAQARYPLLGSSGLYYQLESQLRNKD
eukprot:gb/GECH01014490.1/.p1 GENE.gb/GECH01014490.1/~~gb/GECH01014490.1/.p1  ORF type:complete len:362 (+),score=80.29 gb/GECH01014490.1/:1-1086(+)